MARTIDDHANDRVADICDELLGRAEELEHEARVLRATVARLMGKPVSKQFGFAPEIELTEDDFVAE